MTTEKKGIEQTKFKGRPTRLEDRRIMSNYVDKKLYDSLHDISRSTRLTKSSLLDKALELLVEHYNNNDENIKYNNK